MKKWEIVKSSVVHKNKYFSIVAEQFRLKNGKFGKYYLLKVLDFVSVVAIEDGFVYFVEMDRYALKKRILEIPMGGMEEGETPIQSAKRELREETGITAKKMTKIGCLESFKGRSDQRFFVFIAEGLSFGVQDLDEVEAESGVKIVKLRISEISEFIRKGKITDSHTIASFQLFMLNYKGPK
ncbi:MAG: NUDIX hydrolase [Candidatus Paceibacterota bacterium]